MLVIPGTQTRRVLSDGLYQQRASTGSRSVPDVGLYHSSFMKIPGTLPAVSASILVLLVLLGLAGCSSTRSVSMNAMNPAEMTFPKEIRTILIVDRSEFHDGTVGLLESVLTGEIPDQDRKGLQTMISELRNQLAWSGRFRTAVASEVLPGNSLTGVFPEGAWSNVLALLATSLVTAGLAGILWRASRQGSTGETSEPVLTERSPAEE